MSPQSESPTLAVLLEQAQRGSREALGQVLESYRAYLLAVAGDELTPELRAKVGASDLVQDTFLEAHRDFGGFRGRTEEELLAWLRRILLNNLANCTRHYQATGKRQVARELGLDHSSRRELKESLPADLASPSEQVIGDEKLERLQHALESLASPFREVIRWRNLDRLPFAEIARRTNRSEKAAQKLWARAIQELQKCLDRGT